METHGRFMCSFDICFIYRETEARFSAEEALL